MESVLRGVLRQYGLESLVPWAIDMIVRGFSEPEILQSMRRTPQFQARFPAIAEREAAGLSAISPADYVNYERAASQLGAYYGIPFNLANREAIRQLLVNDVSANELESRIREGFGRVQSLPPEVRQWFGEIYGPSSDRALASFFIDPDLAAPELLRMAQAAEAGGRAARLGIGIDRATAEGLARSDISSAQLQSGFEELANTRALYDETISETDNLDVNREGVAATFGTNANARRAVQRRADRRAAEFAGIGDVATDRGGVIGLGVADR
jgi:hypothetical protein